MRVEAILISMGTSAKVQKQHKNKIRTLGHQKKTGAQRFSESNTNASPKKQFVKTPLTMDDLFLRVPDSDWEPIPFADADVPPERLQAAKDAAVQAFTEWGVIVEASRASGLGRNVIAKLRRADPVFHERMRAALKNNNERIEREMRRRGQLPKGELAAIFVMKHNIKKYREIQRIEMTGKGGGPVLHADVKSELLKRLESLALKQRTADTPERQVVGGPRLLKSGGSDAEVHTIKKVKGEGFGVRSKK